MRFGIYAPYNRSESTMMAVRATSTAVQAGSCVTWLAPTVSGPVHPYWDKHIRLATPERLKAFSKCSCQLWFTLDMPALKLGRGENMIAVPDWHRLKPAECSWLLDFEMVLFPHRPMLNAVQNLTGPGRFRICNWTPGIKPVLRCGGLSQHRKLVAVADSRLCKQHGHRVIAAVADLLAEPALENASLMLVLDTAPDRREWRDLRQAVAKLKGRLNVMLRPPQDKLLAAINAGDWLLHLSLQTTSGLLIKQAQAMGVPVCTWNVCPFNAYVRKANGILVDCQKQISITGAETAIWDSEALLKQAEALADPHKLFSAQTSTFGCAELHSDEEFRCFWQQLENEVFV